ncbi:DUF4350 domain-containing protein [Thermococcus sp. JdF3]|uniref:DUF4350 domain-containing protein n=1 Tax=Thermococcus sp. JdF3 TaxID=1638258 RepID=UPI00143B3C85|nr:DUF4350 domain-containing protein [Thermococcus sp. JdF3]
MRRVVYAVLLVVGLFLVIAPLSIPVFTSNTPFSVLNTGWDGCSRFGKLLYGTADGKIVPVFSPFDSFGLSGKRGTLLIIGPDMGYSSAEIDEIREFLKNGGTLVLMDDFGTGNEILSGLGLSARFSSKPYRDVFYYKNENFPVLVRILDPALAENVSGVILNVPSVLQGVGGEIYTSKVAVVGSDFSQYPVMAEVDYGDGRIVLFSDPSVFINDMYGLNENFIRNFADYAFSGPVYIDEAHHSNFNLYHRGYITVRRSADSETIFYVFLFVALIALFVESGLAWLVAEKILALVSRVLPSEAGEPVEAVVRRLAERGYREDILLKMVREIETGRKLGGGK